MEEKLRGVFAPISTPFYANGEVCWEGLASNVKRYAAAGLHGYLALGSNGENKSLTNDEKLRVLKVIMDNKGADQVQGNVWKENGWSLYHTSEESEH